MILSEINNLLLQQNEIRIKLLVSIKNLLGRIDKSNQKIW